MQSVINIDACESALWSVMILSVMILPLMIETLTSKKGIDVNNI